ncbi:hypothetical protein Tco_0184526 [Tanacetum coccineum]
MIPLTVPSPIATPTAVETEGFLTEMGAQVQMQGGLISNHARYRFRSLEYGQERVAVTFRAIFRAIRRLVLALKAWAGQMDAQRAALWHAINDVQGENQDLRLQLAEERCALLELAEVVDGMRRGQEPKGEFESFILLIRPHIRNSLEVQLVEGFAILEEILDNFGSYPATPRNRTDFCWLNQGSSSLDDSTLLGSTWIPSRLTTCPIGTVLLVTKIRTLKIWRTTSPS